MDTLRRPLTHATKFILPRHPTQPQVQIKAKRNANKRDLLRSTDCPRLLPGPKSHSTFANGQALLRGQPAIKTAATADLCHAACRYECVPQHMQLNLPWPCVLTPGYVSTLRHSDPVVHKLFYFTVTADGACYCADADAPQVVWDPSATVRPSYCMAWCPPGDWMVLFLKKVQQAPNPIRV